MPSSRSRRTARAGVTLARALSKLGVLSRTQAAAAVTAGRVTLDGRVVRDPARWIDPDRGRLTLDGRAVVAQRKVYLALHKPIDIVTTRADERARRTVYDLLPDDTPWVSPVGRLDRDSSGLLLLTNDTQLAERITGPDVEVAKVYEVAFDAPLTATSVARMRDGMTLDDGTALRPVGIETFDGGRRARLTLHEGKNRQIRRMASACGVEVVTLHRIAIGPIGLGSLAAGEVRALNATELQRLRAATRKPT